MKTRIFYKQMGRSFRTLLTNGVILLVTTAFFVMSLNLYVSSVHNLKQAEDTYSTIAIMELQGDVDKWGKLADPADENYQGYLSVGVDSYDFSAITQASGVTDYDLRARYAAYIEGEPAVSDLNGGTKWGRQLLASQGILRFTLAKDEPVTIPISWSEEYWDYYASPMDHDALFLKVIDSAGRIRFQREDFTSTGIYSGPGEESRAYYADQVKKLNRSEEIDYVTLYPGVEYIAAISLGTGWNEKPGSGGLFVNVNQEFHPNTINYFSSNYTTRYSRYGEEWIDCDSFMIADAPFPVARWEDVQSDPTLLEKWQGAWDTLDYNMCSYHVCLTDDITGVPVFHLGGAILADGRMITPEEYESGAKVCMVSKKMAQLQHWKVGDKLDMNFYEFEVYPNTTELSFGDQPIYHKDTKGFFDSGEYEIVGVFDQKKLTGNSGISQSTLAMPWNLIYLPHNSVQAPLAEEQLRVHAALLTFWLENGSIDAFLEDMEALGLTEKTEGQYHPSFTFYDQGFSIVQPGLQSMHGTAKLLLILSALLLTVTCVLLGWFFAQKQKHHIGIFRMLGGKKHRAVSAVLACALLIALLGAIPGAVLGHRLSDRVGETLLPDDPDQNAQLAALRAYVLAPEDGETMEIIVQADKQLSAVACCAALLFPLMTLVFVWAYIGSEPRTLLPQNKT